MKSIILTVSQVLLTLSLYAAGTLVIGLALFPSAVLVLSAWSHAFIAQTSSAIFLLCLALGAGYFLFGMYLIVTVGAIRILLCISLKEGEFKIGSLEMLKWYFVNAMFLIVRTVFMDFMLLTPLCSLFYRMMGVKLGRNVQINSKNVADHSLLEIGDNSVIGGNATVIGHSFESKGLRLAKIKIGKNVIIGLNAVIMPGVTIGDYSVVAAGAIVPKQTTIEPHTIYFSRDKQIKKN
jgi:hypothetical protein